MTRMRRLFRTFLTLLALLFLLEAWLWDHLEPLVARFVNLIAWDELKARLRALIERLPPWATLVVFIVPFICLLPLKFLEVYLLATRKWMLASLVLVFAKLLGVGVTAFVFDATKDKLLQMAWFKAMYDWFIWLRDWAHTQVEPVKEYIRRYAASLRRQGDARFWRRLLRIRRRMQRA